MYSREKRLDSRVMFGGDKQRNNNASEENSCGDKKVRKRCFLVIGKEGLKRRKSDKNRKVPFL